MTPPRDLIGTLSRTSPFRRPWVRRGLFAVVLAVLAVLTFFPERYRAAVTLTPTDPSSLGLGAALGQLGALNTVFGTQAAVEISLKIANSVETRHAVIEKMGLMKRLNFSNETEASRWLEKNVSIRALRGGIVQVETFNRDPDFGRALVNVVTNEMRQRLGAIARRQTAYKRDILVELVAKADDRLARAQTAYDLFRRNTRFSNPSTAIDAIGNRIPVLQASIKAKEVELSAARQFATDENISVKQILSEIEALRQQLAQFQALSPSGSNSLGRVVQQSTQSQKLERELALATSLYYNYRNFLAGTTVEDLTSTANVRILETPFIDTDRQLNKGPMILFILILLLAGAIEFYAMRPPVGTRREIA
jgi:capsule polysaccharide export protein KpsE/RkpR